MRYTVVHSGQAIPAGRVFEIGNNLKTGGQDFARDFGEPTTLEFDLLVLASSVFAADRATQRGEREDYARDITLKMPITNVGRIAPLVKQIEHILYLLSNDSWTLECQQAAGPIEAPPPVENVAARALLFSGGLDSMAAAIEFGRNERPLQLVSHKTRNTATDRAQNQLATLLDAHGYNCEHHQYFVSSTDAGPLPFDHAVENTQRTRSFLFLVLGALVARRTGSTEILYMAENGQLAIHLPLTSARVGAFSTHTAHPSVLHLMQDFLSTVLQADITIENPYLYRTKQEVAALVREGLTEALAVTSSCWKNSRLPAGVTHCGECVPCLVRRIAIEYTGVDETTYARDMWVSRVEALGPDDDGRRNLVDLAEFIGLFASAAEEELVSAYPELLSSYFDGTEAIDMYRRFAAEARTVLGRQPALAPLVS